MAKGLIRDTFSDVVIEKLKAYGIETVEHCYPGDDEALITEKIAEYKAKGVDMILCTGGMSVDPDDRTPGAIKRSGAQIVTYAKSTIFDIMLPRIAAGIPVKAEDFYVLGHGGLCLGCAECRFPDCSFGKV